MCLFPKLNLNKNSISYKNGVTEFNCGYCPECLSQKSKRWALRSCAESVNNIGCMITLTYDDYIHDEHGNRIGERLDTRPLSKRDCQLFIKRLRKNVVSEFMKANRRKKISYAETMKKARKKVDNMCKKLPFSERKSFRVRKLVSVFDDLNTKRILFNKSIDKYNSDLLSKAPKISYLLAGERGSRTNRAHYHLLIFGYNFPDRIYYQRSKRGNIIYSSPFLTRTWNKGICTVDTINITGACARYCTKYTAKQRSNDTFMLFSHGIGEKYLLENFNGISYIFDGVEYAIPRNIWQKKITEHFQNNYLYKKFGCSYKYRSFDYLKKLYDTGKSLIRPDYAYDYYSRGNEIFRKFRDSWKLYRDYISYWQKKADDYKKSLPPVLTRVQQLDNKKYFSYKQKALDCLEDIRLFGEYGSLVPCVPVTDKNLFLYNATRFKTPYLKTDLGRTIFYNLLSRYKKPTTFDKITQYLTENNFKNIKYDNLCRFSLVYKRQMTPKIEYKNYLIPQDYDEKEIYSIFPYSFKKIDGIQQEIALS